MTATGKKPKRADMDAGDGFFKFTEQGYRVKHRAIAADHYRKVNLMRKCAGWDTIGLASKRRSRLLEPHLDSMRFERTAQIHKSRQRAVLVRVGDDSDFHGRTSDKRESRCWQALWRLRDQRFAASASIHDHSESSPALTLAFDASRSGQGAVLPNR